MRRAIALTISCALLTACGYGNAESNNDLAKPPYVLPLFDGKDKPAKTPPVGEYKLAPLPNARELFDMVVSCWPEKSWFRGELSAESRITKRVSDSSASNSTSFDPISGQYTTNVGSGEKFVGLVFRIPLWSAVELDKEREREIGRREKIAGSVGDFINALANWQMDERELVLMKSLERRSQERVGLGIAETNEQVKYLEKVAAIDRSMVGARAKLITARVNLQGMCDERKSWVIDEYLKRFKDVE